MEWLKERFSLFGEAETHRKWLTVGSDKRFKLRSIGAISGIKYLLAKFERQFVASWLAGVAGVSYAHGFKRVCTAG